MDEKKKNKNKVQVLISTLIFTIAFFVAIYIMINLKNNFIAIGLVTIVALLSLSSLISALIEINAENNKARSDQFENLYKSEKASYLMSKKNMEEILYRLQRVERASIVPTEEIVSAQKGIAKVIINRNRENAEAIMNSNDLLNERFDDFEIRLKTNNREHIDETRTVNSENLQQYIEKQQEVIINLKDMELRLNSSIMQAQKMLAEQKALIEHPKVISQPYIQSAPVNPVQIQQGSTFIENNSEENKNTKKMPEVQANDLTEEQILEIEKNDSAIEEISIPDIMDVSESIQEGSQIDETIDNENIEEEIQISKAVENESMEEELQLSETIDNELDVESQISEVVEESKAEEEIGIPDIGEKDDSEEKQPESTEEKPPMPDLSDPNKTMSPDEIAALLASMTEDESEESDKAKEEDKNDEIIEVLDTDISKDEGPALEMSDDPNKMMSPEEIAALVANVNDEPEPVKEEKPPMPDLSDPNKIMSPDEIAALIANTGGGEPEPVKEEIVPDDILSEVDDEIAHSSQSEEKPPMPDLSDPNRKMSPDEIAALFANM